MAVCAPVAEPAPILPRDSRGRRRRIVTAVAVAVVAFAAATTWWLRHDTALLRDDVARSATTGHVGATSYLRMGVAAGASSGPVLDLRSVEPAVLQNTSDATVAVMVCTVGPIPGSGMHDADSDVPLGCASVAAFTPGKLDLNPLSHLLVVAVTPHKPGTFTIDGADVAYQHGLRSGHQRAGERMRVTANAE